MKLLLFIFFIASAFGSIASDKLARDALCNSFGSSTLLCQGVNNVAFPVCDEPGITCDQSGEVTRLAFKGSGSIPTEIGFLSSLTSLQFDDDSSFGSLPAQIGFLDNLEELSVIGLGVGVTITGQLPTEIGRWTSLRKLELFGLKGKPEFPDEIGSWSLLETYIAFFCTLGPVLPPTISNWASVKNFNQLYSSFDPVGPLHPLGFKEELETFSAVNVLFTSWDDPAIFNSPKLEIFSLIASPPMLATIPNTVGNAQNLKELSFIGLSFLVGTLPSTIGSATSLTSLAIEEVSLTGTLPSTLSNLQNLEILSITATMCSGPLPDLPSDADLVSIILRGTGNDPLLCGQTFSGNLPQSWANAAWRSATTFQISDTCVGGLIPPVSDERNSVQFGGDFQEFLLDGNRFIDPLPQWVNDVVADKVSVVSQCDLRDNRFCYKPAPASVTGGPVCLFSIDGAVDACGVCEGDDSTCKDCNGVENGSSVYDICDVCDGNGQSCLDCEGTPNGPAVYDRCDVCAGNDSTLDCNGVCGGSSVNDVCGVCDGDGTACLDCSGVPNGTLQYDRCDVCGGRDTTCVDCANVVNGVKIVDVCGDCVDPQQPDYVPLCCDCEGIPFGTTERDLCGVCGGDNSSCLDHIEQQQAGERGVRTLTPFLIGAAVVFGLALITCIVCVLATRPATRRRPRPPAQRFAPAGSDIHVNTPVRNRARTGQFRWNNEAYP